MMTAHPPVGGLGTGVCCACPNRQQPV